MTAPPIPLRCMNRPTVGGLVVPWVALEHPHRGPVFGLNHLDRTVACITRRLCQLCGQRLDERVVVVCRSRDIGLGWTSEPGMHPECARYAVAACPMTNGTMTHHRRTPIDLTDYTCADPACSCHTWRSGDDRHIRAGRPADNYVSLWLRIEHYRPALDEHGVPRFVQLDGVPLRTRPIPRPGGRPGDEFTDYVEWVDAARQLTAVISGL